ncbi:MAG: NB-ARC domain-containing protein [Hormoscilla sp.]
MDVQEVYKWLDELVVAKTGKHLNTLEQEVLTGIWDNTNYREIAADRYHCSEANVKRVASKLLKLVSAELGEEVKKSNFRAAMERYHISNLNFGEFVGGNINVCGESLHSGETAQNRSPSSTPDNLKPEKRHDLTDAPECDRICNRTSELTTLKQWILGENSRIVTIFGLSGIGKTTLARELVEQIKDKFDRVIWRSHSQFATLNSLTTNLIEFLSEPPATQLPGILDYLRSHSCLIVLDDMQEICASGELAGTYLPEYENYGKFLKIIGRSGHKSCLLLLSWEQPIEMATVENRHCRTLQLQGLGESGGEILKSKGLRDEDRWLELIDLYSGNPLWLNIIASTIQELFNGSVSQLLSCPTVFLGDLERVLQESYQRLSSSEKQVLIWLGSKDVAVDISRKPRNLPLSQPELWKAVQSLKRRCLVEKVTDSDFSGTVASGFILQPVIKEFAKNISQQVSG